MAVAAQGEPIAYVGNYGASNYGVGNYGRTNDSATGTTSQVTIPFFRLADDIRENGIPGAVVVADPNTGLLTTLTDFGNLHEFNIAFERQDSSDTFGFQTIDVSPCSGLAMLPPKNVNGIAHF